MAVSDIPDTAGRKTRRGRKTQEIPKRYTFHANATKAIQADLGIFTHILAYSDIFKHKQAYSGIIWAYSGIFRTLCNPSIFKTLLHSEPKAYSELWYIQNPVQYLQSSVFPKIVNGHDYFHNISFSSSLLSEKNMIF